MDSIFLSLGDTALTLEIGAQQHRLPIGQAPGRDDRQQPGRPLGRPGGVPASQEIEDPALGRAAGKRPGRVRQQELAGAPGKGQYPGFMPYTV